MNMTTENEISLVRDIASGLPIEGSLPADLFHGVADYRDFVRTWRTLYREISLLIRRRRVCWRAKASEADHLRFGHPNTEARKARRRLAEEWDAHSALPSTELKRMLRITRPVWDKKLDTVFSSDATWMLLQRATGKRWAREYLRFGPRPGG